MHKAGFVTILGNPNVGKSTLMNQLMGERLSIITQKAQTTRHRILGVISEENYQIVFSDKSTQEYKNVEKLNKLKVLVNYVFLNYFMI